MYCSKCGKQISDEAVICPGCGVPTPEYKKEEKANPQIVINNVNSNEVNTAPAKNAKNKWISLLLCLFIGGIGAHKFYEGKIGMGILYIFTLGLFGIGALVDFIIILTKPNPYYV